MIETFHCVFAMKPVEGGFAENARNHGVAGLNIDECRIGVDGGTARDGRATKPNDLGWENMRGHGIKEIDAGRWPPNVIHDGCEAIVEAFPLTGPSSGHRAGGRRPNTNDGYQRPGKSMYQDKEEWYGISDDGGSASRFFHQVSEFEEE